MICKKKRKGIFKLNCFNKLNNKNTINTKVVFISLSVLQRYNLYFNLQNF